MYYSCIYSSSRVVGVYVYDIIFLCVVNNLKKEECQDTHANTWTTDTQTLTDRIHQAVRKKNNNKGVVVVVYRHTFFYVFGGTVEWKFFNLSYLYIFDTNQTREYRHRTITPVAKKKLESVVVVWVSGKGVTYCTCTIVHEESYKYSFSQVKTLVWPLKIFLCTKLCDTQICIRYNKAHSEQK